MSKDSFDPMAAWQDLLRKWEVQTNEWSGKVTETEQFGAWMNGAAQMSLITQRAVAEQMEKILRSLNLPSKSQLDAMSERLDAIEEGIANLRAMMARDGVPPPAPRPAPSRHRQPPADRA